ncbi:hypothetical protein KKH39_00395 [Patescibacteria group bacterium]|nr:hypothetical protein [Patescibacteria group bacterium]
MSTPTPEKNDVEKNQITAAIGYIGILCFVPLFLAKKSKFAQFHAKQGVMLFAFEIVGMIIAFLMPFVMIISVILAVLGIKACLDGRYWELPVLGKYAKKINL